MEKWDEQRGGKRCGSNLSEEKRPEDPPKQEPPSGLGREKHKEEPKRRRAEVDHVTPRERRTWEEKRERTSEEPKDRRPREEPKKEEELKEAAKRLRDGSRVVGTQPPGDPRRETPPHLHQLWPER